MIFISAFHLGVIPSRGIELVTTSDILDDQNDLRSDQIRNFDCASYIDEKYPFGFRKGHHQLPLYSKAESASTTYQTQLLGPWIRETQTPSDISPSTSGILGSKLGPSLGQGSTPVSPIDHCSSATTYTTTIGRTPNNTAPLDHEYLLSFARHTAAIFLPVPYLQPPPQWPAIAPPSPERIRTLTPTLFLPLLYRFGTSSSSYCSPPFWFELTKLLTSDLE